MDNAYLNYQMTVARGGPEIFKGWGGRGRELYVGHRLAGEENFRFQTVLKGQSNVRNYKFLAKYFYHFFQIFSIFIDKILSIFQNLLTLW